jgi:hypothetical protein
LDNTFKVLLTSLSRTKSHKVVFQRTKKINFGDPVDRVGRCQQLSQGSNENPTQRKIVAQRPDASLQLPRVSHQNIHQGGEH